MIEILFGESEAASMKAAKSNKIISRRQNGPVAVMGKERRAQDLQKEEKQWIPGTSDEVICLEFMLDIGDIKEEADSDFRKKLIDSMLSKNQQERGREIQEKRELERLTGFLEAGEAVRIWYSDAPYSRCGLCFVCSFLKGFDNPVSVVKMPEYRAEESHVTMYHNWGNVAAEEFSYFLQYEKTLTVKERRMYEIQWLKLVEENAHLRAVINGELISVEKDFYDFLIWRCLGDRTVKEARLIGEILGRSPVSVGDWWYASRIEHFIEEGRIRILQDSEHKYARTICRAD